MYLFSRGTAGSKVKLGSCTASVQNGPKAGILVHIGISVGIFLVKGVYIYIYANSYVVFPARSQ